MRFQSKVFVKPKTIVSIIKWIGNFGLAMYILIFIFQIIAGDFEFSSLGKVATTSLIVTAYNSRPNTQRHFEGSLAELECDSQGMTLHYLQMDYYLKNRVFRFDYEDITDIEYNENECEIRFDGVIKMINTRTGKVCKKLKEYILYAEKKMAAKIVQTIEEKTQKTVNKI